MDLIQLANIGEFIGGIAVLVTLVYSAVQVREGSWANSAQLFANGVNDFNLMTAGSVEQPRIALMYGEPRVPTRCGFGREVYQKTRYSRLPQGENALAASPGPRSLATCP